MVTRGARAEEREVLPITFTNLFIRHNLKSWNWVEVFVQADAASCCFCPLSSSVVALISVLRSCPPLPPSHRPEHQGIMGYLGGTAGGRERRE